MSNDITSILRSIKSNAFAFCLKQMSIWKRDLDDETEMFVKVLNKGIDELLILVENQNPQYDIWEAFRLLLNSLFSETAKWKYPSKNASGIIFGSLQEDLNRIIKEQEKQVLIKIVDDYYKPTQTDNHIVLAWKLGKRATCRLSKLQLGLLNLIRRFFRKDIQQSRKRLRTVSLPQFLNCNLNIPLISFIIDEWQKFLFKRSRLVDDLHESINLLTSELLPSDITSDSWVSVDRVKTKSSLKNLKSLLDRFQIDRDDKDESSSELKTTFEAKWQELVTETTTRWNYAGTMIYSKKRYSSGKFAQKLKETQARASDSLDAWSFHQSGIQHEWQKDLELAALQIKILQICHRTVETIERKIIDDIVPVFDNTGKVIIESLNRFNQPITADLSQLKKTIINENRRLLKDLRRQNLPRMIDAMVKADIESDLENYLNTVRRIIEELSESHTIFTYKDVDNYVPKSKTDDIPLKELAYIELFLKLRNEHDVLLQYVKEQSSIILRSISEIDEIVEYNLEAALNLLEESSLDADLQKPKQVVAEGLERTRGQVEDIEAKVRKIQEFSSEKLHEITIGFQHRLRELLDDKKIVELKIRLTRAKAREQLLSYKKKVWVQLTGLLPSVVKGIGSLLGFIQRNIFRIRRFTGLTVPTARFEDRLTAFLIEADKRIAGLPYVYQRLFRPEPLQDERFFDGRNEEMEILKTQLQSWRKGYFANTVLVGEKGTGKTTLLNFVESMLFDRVPVVRYDLDSAVLNLPDLVSHLSLEFGTKKTHDIAILTERLLESEPRVCIIENLNNMYIRAVGGLDTLEQMLLLMSQTGEKILWITSCSIYSWHYLDSVLNLSKYFNRIVYLDALARSEIENIVMRRHRVSGYELVFNLPDDSDDIRKYKRLSSAEAIQSALYKDFFDELSELASGNISVAMQYYLRAIKEVTEDRIMISPLENFDYTFLFQLTSDDLFSLAAILQHGELSEDDHARIFQQDASRSRLLLKKMRNSGILIEAEGRYRVHPLLYRPVVRALKSRNILH